MKESSEHRIQNLLHRHLQQSGGLVFPNISCITGFEADLLHVKKSKFEYTYAYEYEIKTSLLDLKADKKKVLKHLSLKGSEGVKYITNKHYPRIGGPFICVPSDYPDNLTKNTDYAWSQQCYPEKRPRQFWYVIEGFTPPDNIIPEYAGLMLVENGSWLRVIKVAPKLRTNKVSAEDILHATANMTFRYWDLRKRKRK